MINNKPFDLRAEHSAKRVKAFSTSHAHKTLRRAKRMEQLCSKSNSIIIVYIVIRRKSLTLTCNTFRQKFDRNSHVALGANSKQIYIEILLYR